MEDKNQEKAVSLVRDYVNAHLDKTDEPPVFGVFVVWYSYQLGGWKALVSTTLPDGMYYEITHNRVLKETYLDAYKKFDNIMVKN